MLNLAQVLNKQSEWKESIKKTSAVLEIDSVNIKALFRRGVAYGNDGNFEAAKVDLDRVI